MSEELKRQILEGKRVALVNLLRAYGAVTEDGEIMIVLPGEEEEPGADQAQLEMELE